MPPKTPKEKEVDFTSLALQLEAIGKNVEGMKKDINTVKEDVKSLEGLKADMNSVRNDVSEMKEENKKLSENLTQSIRDNVGKLKSELLEKIGAVKEVLEIDISGVKSQLGDMTKRLHSVESRVSERKPYQTEFTAVITGEPYDPEEDPGAIASNIITNGLGIVGIEFIRAKRWAAKPDLGRNGVIKVEFATEAQRDKICESSKLLKDIEGFKHIYINKCRTNAEMIQRRNVFKLKSQIPGCEHMKVNWYGELYEPSYRGIGQDAGNRGRGGSAGTSNGAGRDGLRTNAFDGNVFGRPPNVNSLSDFPNLNGDEISSNDSRP